MLVAIDCFRQSFASYRITALNPAANVPKNATKSPLYGNQYARADNLLSFRMAKKHLIFHFALNGSFIFFIKPFLQFYHSAISIRMGKWLCHSFIL
jgi:hypothetical protein